MELSIAGLISNDCPEENKRETIKRTKSKLAEELMNKFENGKEYIVRFYEREVPYMQEEGFIRYDISVVVEKVTLGNPKIIKATGALQYTATMLGSDCENET